jgi:hypothetical protein
VYMHHDASSIPGHAYRGSGMGLGFTVDKPRIEMQKLEVCPFETAARNDIHSNEPC